MVKMGDSEMPLVGLWVVEVRLDFGRSCLLPMY